MVKTPALGFSRIMLGNFEVTALSDGTVELPAVHDVDEFVDMAKIRFALSIAPLFVEDFFSSKNSANSWHRRSKVKPVEGIVVIGFGTYVTRD